MGSRIVNRRDLEFQLFEVLDLESLRKRPRFAQHSRETMLAALDTALAIAEEKFAPHNRKADEHEPTFDGQRVHLIPEVKEALDAYIAAGFLSATEDYEKGGMQLPATVGRCCQAVFAAALQKAGVPAELLIYEDGVHAFLQFPTFDMGRDALAKIAAFCRKRLAVPDPR